MKKAKTKLLLSLAIALIVCMSCCVLMYVSGATNTVYVDPSSGNDSNAGTSASPYKTLEQALTGVGSTDTKIVIKSNLTVSGDFEEPKHTGNATITCNSGVSITFSNSSGAVYRLNGPTTFESVSIKLSKIQVFAAQHNPIVFGSNVTVTGGSSYAFVVGGYESPHLLDLPANVDSHITINSGSFYRVCGFTRTKGIKSYTFTGTSNITVNGGSVAELYGASLYNHYSGSANITVNGGTVSKLYAAGDVTRRLNGDADITVNGGTVTNVYVNNVVGDATLTLNGGKVSSAAVSYYNTTISGLAEKAGSKKTFDYNAMKFSSSIASGFDETLTSATEIYVADGASGNGASASAPMSSFAKAYETAAKYGCTLYVVGTSTVDRATVDGSYTGSVTIKGYSSGDTISIPEGYNIDLYTATSIENVALAAQGTSKLICHAGGVGIGSGVSVSGSISIYASSTEGADSTVSIESGTFTSVVANTAASAGKINISITGGTVSTLTGSEGTAKSVRLEIAGGTVGTINLARGGVSGDTNVKLANGSITKYVSPKTTGKTVLTIASTSVSNFDNSALDSSGESTLVLGVGASKTEFSSILTAFDSIEQERFVYVKDGGTGDGLSALTPASDLSTAVKTLGAKGTVVVMGKVTVPSAGYRISTHSYPITITTRDSENDYYDVASIDVRNRLIMGGETLIENIRFTCPYSNAFLYANEKKFTIGENVDTTLTEGNTSYINISGCNSVASGKGNSNVTVNSGNWGKFRGGTVHATLVSASNASVNVTINGGTFHGYFILGSRGTVNGSAELTVNGGTFMQGVFAFYEEDGKAYSITSDVSMFINGGHFYSEIAPAKDIHTELHGTYSVYLAGGEFQSLTELSGPASFGGDMTSELVIDPEVNIKLPESGNVSFTNYLRKNNADPFLFYHDGYYYYTRTGSSSIALIKTANIADIKTADYKVICKPTTGVNMWSPEIHFFTEEEAGEGNEGWYLFIGHDDGTTANQRQYVAKCLDGDNLMGRWGDPVTGEVNVLRKVTFPDSPETNETALCGGSSVLRVNGKTYITFVSEVNRGTSSFHQTINITEFENPWTMKGKPVVICEPDYDWESHGYGTDGTKWWPKVVEGASAVYSDSGDTYLMYTGSGYWTIYYQLGYMKLKKGSDPMVRSNWTKNPDPVFSLSDEVNGCGHASYFKDHNGDYWACYHGYLGQDTFSKRQAFVERIYVTSDGVSIGNGSGHPAPLSTVYTMSVNPMTLEQKIVGFDSVEYEVKDIVITTPAQLIDIMNNPNYWSSNIKLAADIDLSEYTGSLAQAPIGNVTVPFAGSFDGCGYTIKGINITSDVSAGLFGRISGAALVKSFTAYGSVKNNGAATSAEFFDDDGNYYSTGGIVGSVLGGKVENVTSYVLVSGKGNTGGVVGMIYVTDGSFVRVAGCVSRGTVANTYGNTGGLIGRIQTLGTAVRGAYIYGCENYADVNSTTAERCRVGGIVGYLRTETQGVLIEKCTNYGDITGNNTSTATNNIPHVGGIAGRCEVTAGAGAALIISECKNGGTISTRVRGGGIVGIITRSATCTAESGIYRCENRGAVTGLYSSSTVQIGGIAGYIDNNYVTLNLVISDCANYADVSCTDGKGYVGGIIGGQDSTDLIRCVNYGTASGHSTGYTGAVTGVEVNDGLYKITNCYALEGTADKLFGYSRSTYCTESGCGFVNAASISKIASYKTFDFTNVWIMRDEGAVLSVHAPALTGDIDGDLWLTNTDITILVRYLSGWTVQSDISISDMNSDGKLTNRDAIALIVKISETEY